MGIFVQYKLPYYSNNCDSTLEYPLFLNTVKLFYYSKYVEFLDTLFLIVNGKRVSWLHYCHHIGMAMDMSMIYRIKYIAAWIPTFFNSAVHTLMYFYYGMTILKVRIPGKSKLTSLQIIQLATGLSLLWFHIDIPCVQEREEFVVTWMFNYLYVGFLILSFLNFYFQTYIRKDIAIEKVKKES